MQRGRSRRCQVPIRTRRRQSDAKWRAGVASCYETLKFVIPDGISFPKRRASKSLILQETEKHIGTLERALSRLLNIEAQEQGQGVLWNKGDHWSPATLEDFQSDFAQQQSDIFQQSSQGRRCYNMLHDLQEDLLRVSVDPGKLAFLPLTSPLLQPTRDAATCTRRQRLSKARCRYEAERASERILSSFNNGDVVHAVIPASTPLSSTITSSQDTECMQAVPTTPLSSHPPSLSPSMASVQFSSLSSTMSSGTAIRLQKMGNAFVPADPPQDDSLPVNSLSALDRLVLHQPQPSQPFPDIHEVPIMTTPHKQYGFTHHDIIIPTDDHVPDMFSTTNTASRSSVASDSRLHIKREPSNTHKHAPFYSAVCKKLDFSSPPDSQYENEGDATLGGSHDPASLVGSSSAGFTPIKSPAIHTSGVVQLIKPETEDTCSSNRHPVLSPMTLSSPLSVSNSAPLYSPHHSVWTITSMDARVPQSDVGELQDLQQTDMDTNLLCMETFDLDHEVTAAANQKIPQKMDTPSKHKHTCRRRSECKKKRLHDNQLSEKAKAHSQDAILGDDFHNSSQCSDFDGYLLYYQQVAPGLKKKLGSSHGTDSVAAIVSDMWSQLPTDDRHTMVTLAALENQDSNSSSGASLSQDLEEVTVTPIDCIDTT